MNELRQICRCETAILRLAKAMERLAKATERANVLKARELAKAGVEVESEPSEAETPDK